MLQLCHACIEVFMLNPNQYRRRLDVKCVCGSLGRLFFLGKYKEDKEICHFVCVCSKPTVDFQNPYS